MSNLMKYKKRDAATEGEENGKEDEWEEYERSIKKSIDGVRKRYELYVVKNNKEWKVFPLFDVLPSGALWQRPLHSPS